MLLVGNHISEPALFSGGGSTFWSVTQAGDDEVFVLDETSDFARVAPAVSGATASVRCVR